MKNLYVDNTLELDADRCNGCGICIHVCPHAVFQKNGREVTLSERSACMECGACQRNCPTNAIRVDSGVGCAAAMIYQALTGQGAPACR